LSLISGFTNQTVSYEKRTGKSNYTGITYAPAVEIPARKELRQTRVRNAQGSEVLSTTYVLTEHSVALGDKIDGLEIQALESIVNKGGRLLGYEAYL
jgi:hypothetical protein